MYLTFPSFFICLRNARCAGSSTAAAADTRTTSILDTLNVPNFSSSAALVAAASGFGAGDPGTKGGMMFRGVVQKNLS